MSTTANDMHELTAEYTARLEQLGQSDLAESVRAVVATSSAAMVSVAEAAIIAKVSQQTIKNWIARGVVEGGQVAKGRRHHVDRESLLRAIDRRTQVEAAKVAFATPGGAIEFLTGLDAATIKRLGGA